MKWTFFNAIIKYVKPFFNAKFFLIPHLIWEDITLTLGSLTRRFYNHLSSYFSPIYVDVPILSSIFLLHFLPSFILPSFSLTAYALVGLLPPSLALLPFFSSNPPFLTFTVFFTFLNPSLHLPGHFPAPISLSSLHTFPASFFSTPSVLLLLCL